MGFTVMTARSSASRVPHPRHRRRHTRCWTSSHVRDATRSSARARARAALVEAGRLGMLVNPVADYLRDHDPTYLQLEIDRLRRAGSIAEPAAGAALARAIAAREQQLAVHAQLTARRARVFARLEA